MKLSKNMNCLFQSIKTGVKLKEGGEFPDLHFEINIFSCNNEDENLFMVLAHDKNTSSVWQSYRFS